jgi:single-strand DNA-binding protein
MMNSVNLTGRLTKEPELRYTASGVAVANITLAVNRPFTNQQGEREADFIRCIAWKGTAETMANHLQKGALIAIEGSIRTGSYEDDNGKTVWTTDVNVNNFHFLESKGEQQQQPQKKKQYNKRK